MRKNMKRIVSLFLILALVASMVPAAFAAEIETEPSEAEDAAALPSEETEPSVDTEETEPPAIGNYQIMGYGILCP